MQVNSLFEAKLYKPSAIIQADKNEIGFLAQKQFNALLYCVKNGYTTSPYDLCRSDFDYVHSNKDIFDYVDHAIPISVLKHFSRYKSRDTAAFKTQLRNLSRAKCSFNILGKDNSIKAGMQINFIQILGLDNKDSSFEDVLDKKPDGYMFFSFSNIIQDYIEKKHIGTNILLDVDYKNQYAMTLSELIFDYAGTDNFLGKKSIKKLAAIIGGTKYLNISFAKFRQTCLEPAMKVINSLPYFKIEIEQIYRVRNTPADIRFKVTRKNKISNKKEILNAQIEIKFFNKLKSKILTARKTYTNIFFKNEQGVFICLNDYLNTFTEKEKEEKFIKYLEEDYIIDDNFYNTVERNFLVKEEIDIVKSLFNEKIKEIDSDYSNFYLLDSKNGKHEIIENWDNSKGKGISHKNIKNFIFEFDIDHTNAHIIHKKSKRSYKINQFDIKKKTFLLNEIIIEKNKCNYETIVEFLRKNGISTYEKATEIVITIENINEYKKLIELNIKTKNDKYFKLTKGGSIRNNQAMRIILYSKEFNINNLIKKVEDSLLL